jgi:hypothetical protein
VRTAYRTSPSRASPCPAPRTRGCAAPARSAHPVTVTSSRFHPGGGGRFVSPSAACDNLKPFSTVAQKTCRSLYPKFDIHAACEKRIRVQDSAHARELSVHVGAELAGANDEDGGQRGEARRDVDDDPPRKVDHLPARSPLPAKSSGALATGGMFCGSPPIQRESLLGSRSSARRDNRPAGPTACRRKRHRCAQNT